ncbi:LrgB family protein [Vagococcus sp. DIV0080]|uniref:LrgB family protein n=1 Tax=Candidatus Vagococcus giribetii TaxID=2230876 RepID=A0ABS3HWD3_9ENTE|nr:LrgB family protein [Vagococcus sp. DIV0080]MBO0477141.1 LrgB family protein [Vagococcus sp. DIV0080]
MWTKLITSPFLWISLTAGLYLLGNKLKNKWPLNPLFNPLVFSITIIIGLLMIFNIPLETYQQGGQLFSLFITPATVALAIKLEHNFDYFKRYYPAILTGILTGVVFHTAMIYFFSLLLKLDKNLVMTLIPKSITTAIAVDVSSALGGIVSLTVAVVVFTGVVGALVGPWIMKVFKITDPVAQGVAFGSSAHAVGTSKAIELGEVQGAMSGLSIVITGITVVLLAPLTGPITNLFF